MLNIYYKYGITFCLDIIIGVYRSYMILHRLSILITFVIYKNILHPSIKLQVCCYIKQKSTYPKQK